MGDRGEGSSVDPVPLRLDRSSSSPCAGPSGHNGSSSHNTCQGEREEGSSVDLVPLKPDRDTPSSSDITLPWQPRAGPSQHNACSSQNAWSSHVRDAAHKFWHPFKTVLLKAIFPSIEYRDHGHADTCKTGTGRDGSFEHSLTEAVSVRASAGQVTPSPAVFLNSHQAAETKNCTDRVAMTSETCKKVGDLSTFRAEGKGRSDPFCFQRPPPGQNKLAVNLGTLANGHNAPQDDTVTSPASFVKTPLTMTDSNLSHVFDSLADSPALRTHYDSVPEFKTFGKGINRQDPFTRRALSVNKLQFSNTAGFPKGPDSKDTPAMAKCPTSEPASTTSDYAGIRKTSSLQRVTADPTLTKHITGPAVEKYQHPATLCTEQTRNATTQESVHGSSSTQKRLVFNTRETVKNRVEISAGTAVQERSEIINTGSKETRMQVKSERGTVKDSDIICESVGKKVAETTMEQPAVDRNGATCRVVVENITQATQESRTEHDTRVTSGLQVKAVPPETDAAVPDKGSAEAVSGPSVKGSTRASQKPTAEKGTEVSGGVRANVTAQLNDERSSKEDSEAVNGISVHEAMDWTPQFVVAEATAESLTKPAGEARASQTDIKQPAPCHAHTPSTAIDSPVTADLPVRSIDTPVTGDLPVRSIDTPVTGDLPVQSIDTPVTGDLPVLSIDTPVTGDLLVRSICRSTLKVKPLGDLDRGSPLTQTSLTSAAIDSDTEGGRAVDYARDQRLWGQTGTCETVCTEQRPSRWFATPRFPRNHHIDPSPTLLEFDPTTFRGYHFLRDF